MIRIISKKDGFWRCGIAHPSSPVFYPDDRFTTQEVARLKAEPILIVDENIPDTVANSVETAIGDDSPAIPEAVSQLAQTQPAQAQPAQPAQPETETKARAARKDGK